MRAQLFKISSILFASLLWIGVTGCTKPSKEQIAQALKDDPSLLATAIKKNPEVFQDALRTAQQQLQQDREKEQLAQMEQEQAKYLKDPLQPKLTSAQVFKGAKNAPIVIVEYTDFECPYCSRGSDSMKEVLKKYDGKVRLTVKHLPLPFHPQAMPAAKYFEAIRIQKPEAAIQFHDAVFGNQAELRQNGEKFLEKEAAKLGIKMDKLKADLKSEAVTKKIDEDMNEAKSFGFRGTPSFLIGGVPARGALPPEEFAKIVDKILKKG